MHIRHCAAAAALALTLGSGHAATISHDSTALPLALTDWSSFLDLQQFDPALGTLQSVTVNLSSSLVGSLGTENRNSFATSITLNLKSTVTLQIPGGASGSTLQVMPSVSRSFQAAGWDGRQDYAGSSGFRDGEALADASTSSTYTDPDLLQLFIGTGMVKAGVTAVGEKSHAGEGTYATSFRNRTSAQASVTYIYTDLAPVSADPAPQLAPVPEPGTWALMVAGLGAVGWLAKRRNA